MFYQIPHHSLSMTKVKVSGTGTELSQIDDGKHDIRASSTRYPQQTTYDTAVQCSDSRVRFRVSWQLKILRHGSILCSGIGQPNAGCQVVNLTLLAELDARLGVLNSHLQHVCDLPKLVDLKGSLELRDKHLIPLRGVSCHNVVINIHHTPTSGQS